MKTVLSFFVFALLLSSCAIHNGTISSSNLPANARYEDVAFGVSQTKKFLGIGGLSQDALVFEAKRELYKNRSLLENESYANFTVDTKSSFFLLFSKKTVTVTADVISYAEKSGGSPFNSNFLNKIGDKQFIVSLFAIGDTVVTADMQKMVIISVVSNDEVKVLYKTKSNKIRTRNISIDRIYSQTRSINGLKVGDSYVFNEDSKLNKEDQVGKIIGLGTSRLIIKKFNGELFFDRYRDSNKKD